MTTATRCGSMRVKAPYHYYHCYYYPKTDVLRFPITSIHLETSPDEILGVESVRGDSWASLREYVASLTMIMQTIFSPTNYQGHFTRAKPKLKALVEIVVFIALKMAVFVHPTPCLDSLACSGQANRGRCRPATKCAVKRGDRGISMLGLGRLLNGILMRT